MTKELVVRLRDDLDGSDAVESLLFAVRGVEFEIELSAANVARFEAAVGPFVAAARTVKGQPGKRGEAAASRDGVGRRGFEAMQRNRVERFGVRMSRLTLDDRRAIRAWGREHGFTVGVSGHIATAVLVAFFAANPEMFS